jgi:hypothetical protein
VLAVALLFVNVVLPLIKKPARAKSRPVLVNAVAISGGILLKSPHGHIPEVLTVPYTQGVNGSRVVSNPGGTTPIVIAPVSPRMLIVSRP